MSKRIICMLMLVLLVCGAVINVSAREYFADDFSEGLSQWNMTWTPAGCTRENNNGAMLIKQPPEGDNFVHESNCNVGMIDGECILCFDYMIQRAGSDASYIVANFFNGKQRLSMTIAKGWMTYGGTKYTDTASDIGVWYSVIYHIKGDGTGDIYRKAKDSDTSYIKVSANHPMTNNVRGAGVQLYTGQSIDINVDNFRIFDEAYISSCRMEANGIQMDSVSDIADGEMRIWANIVSSDFIEQGKFLMKRPASLLWTIFDKAGYILDCGAVQTELAVGENAVMIDGIDTSGYYDRAQDGAINFFVLGDFVSAEPLTDDFELR